MATETLKARLALKHDSYDNWIDDSKDGSGANLVLLPGEIGLCEIPGTAKTIIDNGEPVTITTAPTVLFKVGDTSGTPFKDLPWASAKAADVYSWAKSKTKPEYTAEDVGALPSSTTLADLSDDDRHRTVSDSEKQVWNAKSDFSGSYNDLSDKPAIPSTEGLVYEGYVNAELEKKVTVVDGKGLSTNDYTTEEKDKLADIEAGAEVNVQADWEQADSSKADYIKNKPDINSINLAVEANTDNISEINTKLPGFAKLDSNNTFVGEQHFGDVVITGNIIQQGETYETHAEKIYTTDDYIIMRSGATSGLADKAYTGFHATKYDGINDGRLVFDNKGVARVGDIGGEQALATRDDDANLTDGNFVVWDADTLKLVDSGSAPSEFQKRAESTLTTEAKDIPGAINELHGAYTYQYNHKVQIWDYNAHSGTLLAKTKDDDEFTFSRVDMTDKAEPHTLCYRNSKGRIQTAAPESPDDVATKGYVDCYHGINVDIGQATIKIDKENVNTYFNFFADDQFEVFGLRGKEGAEVKNKIFDLTQLLAQISENVISFDGSPYTYSRLVIDGRGIMPIKCIINTTTDNAFSRHISVIFQSVLGYPKAFLQGKVGSTDLEMAQGLDLIPSKKYFVEFDLNGPVYSCWTD